MDGLDLGASPLATISTELGLIDGKTSASIGKGGVDCFHIFTLIFLSYSKDDRPLLSLTSV